MDKGQQFFDPYNFNLQNMQQNVQGMPQMNPMNPMQDMDMMANPAMYYEQQYMYYRYLTQMLEYKIKLKEWEKLNREQAPNSK
jgi:hypothetical protein